MTSRAKSSNESDVKRVRKAAHGSRSHDAVNRVYDDAGNVIETHKHAGEFKKW